MNPKAIFSYFLRGLLFLAPIAITVYVIVVMVQWADNLLPISIPGLGIVTVFLATALVGYLANTIFARPVFNFLAGLLRKVPIVNFIYTSISDLVTAFAGEKNKFTSPVLVPFDDKGVLFKPGFITHKELEEIGLPGMATVYLPHSYNFSGNVFIVDKSKLIPLSGKNTEIMKYIVSAGVSGSVKKKDSPTQEGKDNPTPPTS